MIMSIAVDRSVLPSLQPFQATLVNFPWLPKQVPQQLRNQYTNIVLAAATLVDSMFLSFRPLGVCNRYFKYPKLCSQVAREYGLIWDSGSSLCVSIDKTNFPDGINPHYNRDADNFNGGIEIEGVGIIHWFVKDLQGGLLHLKLPTYFVPGATQRLISPQVL